MTEFYRECVERYTIKDLMELINGEDFVQRVNPNIANVDSIVDTFWTMFSGIGGDYESM